MMPAARLTDLHVCPMVTGVVPHVGGPVAGPGAPIVVILNLGRFHIAWCVNDDEAAHIAQLLRSRRPLTLTLSSPRRRFDISVPPLPVELCTYLQLDYIPVSAA